ncbi:hypothetical protein QJU89_02990 [Pasteurella skyensis]|uniref:Uncharacterized protein n=1 Tax=Phocoenobacter skyensis TaxID=97481 RepID=A0AAJ6P1K2_9PAST|nr:hypothetical protein [Pasteurella skyensis]MDP8163489.1 hypothetical protein [Pasteurella skyensis]MDP8173804.1 hypothetical protein [Pasteurella skyensis]MDP8179953.1 hypothetical protein [Pasteurella skyensis]MDP8182650.1 hypothetical protein [Pasteurella skyensis]MDP8182663.1 hypothetical protein [Pasteurella skyensis]
MALDINRKDYCLFISSSEKQICNKRLSIIENFAFDDSAYFFKKLIIFDKNIIKIRDCYYDLFLKFLDEDISNNDLVIFRKLLIFFLGQDYKANHFLRYIDDNLIIQRGLRLEKFPDDILDIDYMLYIIEDIDD